MLPAILLIGLAARRSRPGPSGHSSDLPATAYAVRESSNLWQTHAIQSKFYSKPDRLQDIYVVLQPAQVLNEPDLLLYWTPSAPRGKALPGEAVLVGALTTGKAFLLPLNEKRAGHLVLFSPAHQAVYDTARVEKLP
jgi:hypothetical protein